MPRPDASAKLAATAPRRSRSGLAIIVAAVVFVGVIVAVVIGATTSSNSGGGGTAFPKGAASLGAAMVVNPQAPASVPVLDVFEDPQCPACAAMDRVYGAAIADLAQTNKAKVVVHTMTFLDTNLKNDASLRAAMGAYCAADQGKFLDYMSAVYAGQPQQEGVGWTAAQLEAFAMSSRVSSLPTWQQCVAAKTYQAHASAAAEAALKDGVNSTPTLRLNGTTLTLTGNVDELAAAVKAATK
jgi:protein-disulfide isomerase